MNNPSTFIFIGKSGSGKGTQAALLIKYLEEHAETSQYPVLYLETGQKFREFIGGGSYTANRAKELMAQGGLMPAYLAVWNWTNVLIEKLKGNEHLIVDGMPRTLIEAMAFDDALEFYGRQNPYLVVLDVTDEEATDRLRKRGRADDQNDEAIKRRLGWYETQVVPAINFYKDRPGYRFLKIDGNPSIEDVHEKIIASL